MASAQPPEGSSQTRDPGSAQPAGERGEQPPWRAWTAPAAVALGLALGMLASFIVGLGAALGGGRPSHPTPAVSIIGSAAFDLSFVAAALYFAALDGRPRPADFGFRRIRPRLAITTLLGAAVVYYVATYAYASVLHLHGRDKLPSEFGASNSTAALIAAAVFVCVLAPIAEEFFFRGFIFGALRRLRVPVGGRDLGTWLAAVLTGMLFGIAHAGSASAQYLIPLAFLGFVLCLIRWRTGSLYPCMALHCANNSLALGVNQLHWSVEEIVALIGASIAVIAALTGPLAAPRSAASR